MKVFGLIGWSGSGKTTLMKKIIPEIVAQGIRVSTIKHTHHDFDIDKPGKDSFTHRQAGAYEVLITGGKRWAILHELRMNSEPTMDELIARLEPVDLVLIEGFKSHRHQKLEVFRPAVGKPLLAIEDKTIVAVASDAQVSDLIGLVAKDLIIINLNNIKSVADFIVKQTGLEAESRNGAA